MRRMTSVLVELVLTVPGATQAIERVAEDVIPGVRFKEGDVLSYEQIDKLKDYLPHEYIIVTCRPEPGIGSSSGTATVPLSSKGKIRRYVDIGRLNKGR